MRVGILGSGDVGRILAAGFVQKGHDVTMGTRDPKATLANDKPGQWGQPSFAAWAKANPKVKVTTFADAAKQGEIAVLAVHGTAAEQAVKLAGPSNLDGKLVLDTTNPLEFGPTGAHKPKSIPDSCIQVAQRAAPKARFVKAWNCTPGGQMVNPQFKEGQGDILLCGDDPKAKEQAAKILKDFGWNSVDVGGSDMGPYVEGAALSVINWAAKANDWTWGLKLVRTQRK